MSLGTFGAVAILLAQAAAPAAQAPRALSLSRPVLSLEPSPPDAYARIVLQGFAADGTLAYLTWAQEDDADVCDQSDYAWTAKLLTLERSGAPVSLYRFEASGNPLWHQSGEVTGTMAEARKKRECEKPKADADEYDRAPEGGKAALAALGKLTPVCDLEKSKCAAPDGRSVIMTFKRARGPREKDRSCADARVTLSIGGKAIYEEHQRDCTLLRDLHAAVTFSKDGHRVAVAWMSEERGVHDEDVHVFGRLDVLPVP